MIDLQIILLSGAIILMILLGFILGALEEKNKL